jgi:hypothetical protein
MYLMKVIIDIFLFNLNKGSSCVLFMYWQEPSHYYNEQQSVQSNH